MALPVEPPPGQVDPPCSPHCIKPVPPSLLHLELAVFRAAGYLDMARALLAAATLIQLLCRVAVSRRLPLSLPALSLPP